MPTPSQHRTNTPAVIAESIDGEVVIIDLGTGTYFSARGVAARIWDGVAAGLDTDRVIADVGSAFDAGDRDVAAAVGTFLEGLVTAGLLVAGETQIDPAPVPAPPASREPWTDPALETFTDMQDLILLDPVHEVEPAAGWPVALAPDEESAP